MIKKILLTFLSIISFSLVSGCVVTNQSRGYGYYDHNHNKHYREHRIHHGHHHGHHHRHHHGHHHRHHRR